MLPDFASLSDLPGMPFPPLHCLANFYSSDEIQLFQEIFRHPHLGKQYPCALPQHLMLLSLFGMKGRELAWLA